MPHVEDDEAFLQLFSRLPFSHVEEPRMRGT